MNTCEIFRHHDEAASRLAAKRGHDHLDFGLTINRCGDWLHLERTGSGLEGRPKIRSTPRRCFGIKHDSDPRRTGRDLRKQVQPLATHCRFLAGETRKVATRTRQARNKAVADWVAHDCKYDRYCLSLAVYRGGHRGAAS